MQRGRAGSGRSVGARAAFPPSLIPPQNGAGFMELGSQLYLRYLCNRFRTCTTDVVPSAMSLRSMRPK
jgi:hypothetical protein